MQEGEDCLKESKLPHKSKEKYITAYENFMKWKKKKKAISFSENVFITYFNEMSVNKKPPTLWAIYSMLKSTVRMKHNINIKSYANLSSLLKFYAEGYKSDKSKILTGQDIAKFINDAPDDKYLVHKVALIFGVAGSCRSGELTYMTTNNIEHHNNMILVKLCDSKTNTDRAFVVRDEFLNVVMKYLALRPNVKTDRLFLNYKNGSCTNQVIGRNAIAALPKDIATYFGLADPECYNGYCFRNSSAAFLADSGTNVMTLKKRKLD